ncbi:MAG TPA: lysophospholipid acyltransferase family protein [Ohtaekwangia sp.]|uniref:lysophospholipid acyltransferase family protein n=1 Tax=Ohtaekwangia sp. TaxID=2066019 RepID=UPI002F94F4FC
MKIVQTILLTLYKVWVFLVFTVFMILYLPGILIPFLMGQRFGNIGYFFLWLWSWTFSILTFIRYEFYGTENFKKGQAYIFVSNHTSFLDIPGIRMIIPGQFRPLAKKELLKIPVFGWIAKAATIIVDRSSPESRKKSIDRLKQFLKQGISILIFAEGTQNRSKEVLQPFHDGAFRIAVDTQQPILPMVVVGAGRLMPPSTINLRPGKIRIYVGQQIETEGLTSADIAALKEKTFVAMKEMITSNS